MLKCNIVFTDRLLANKMDGGNKHETNRRGETT